MVSLRVFNRNGCDDSAAMPFTSLTVPRVRYVVDSGLARVSRYGTRHRVQSLGVEPIAQRGHVHPQHRQPVEQVRPEAALVHFGLQLAVRRRDHAHVDLHRPLAAQPRHLAPLQHPQQAGLKLPAADWTWDELVADAKKLTVPAKKQFGIEFPLDGNVRFIGLEGFEELMTRPHLLRPAYLRIVERYLKEIQKGCDGSGVDYFRLLTSRSLSNALAEYLVRRLQTGRR